MFRELQLQGGSKQRSDKIYKWRQRCENDTGLCLSGKNVDVIPRLPSSTEAVHLAGARLTSSFSNLSVRQAGQVFGLAVKICYRRTQSLFKCLG